MIWDIIYGVYGTGAMTFSLRGAYATGGRHRVAIETADDKKKELRQKHAEALTQLQQAQTDKLRKKVIELRNSDQEVILAAKKGGLAEEKKVLARKVQTTVIHDRVAVSELEAAQTVELWKLTPKSWWKMFVPYGLIALVWFPAWPIYAAKQAGEKSAAAEIQDIRDQMENESWMRFKDWEQKQALEKDPLYLGDGPLLGDAQA